MCGIVGKYYYAQDKRVDGGLIKNMCDQIIHRGPDDEGYYVNGHIGMGMRRLSIIDLEGGHQPISNEDKTVWVIQNGEIYNYLELKIELESKGHIFKSLSDTEVIVHSYEEYGLDFVKQMRGMFAIALWDSNHSRLLLARDRFGKKPLFYVEKNGILWFASEINSILVDPEVNRSVNLNALDFYLSYQYVPTPLSMFDNIYKVPPANIMIIDKSKITFSTYWDLNIPKNEIFSEEEYIEGIQERLTESVKLRLVSDVPIGVFLSGGVDSSIIVSIMAELTSRVKTFSVGFEEESFDELPYARAIAERFGSEHTEYVVKPDILDIIPKLVLHYGEPFGDSSAIPTFYVSKMTRQCVNVALCGDAGDELFAGYDKYSILNNKVKRNKLMRGLDGIGKAVLGKVPIDCFGTESIFKKFYSSLYVRCCGVYDRDFIWMSYFDNFFKKKLYSRFMLSSINLEQVRCNFNQQLSLSTDKNAINRIIYKDIRNYLLDDLLVKVDIASMANSLEVRSPFLDHKFVEYVVGIPTGLKIKNGELKYILKKAYSQRMPKNFFNRPKMGFAVPIDKWFREGLKDYMWDIIEGCGQVCIREYFNPVFIRHLMATHVQGKAQYGSKLWLLLMFILWHIKYIENKKL